MKLKTLSLLMALAGFTALAQETGRPFMTFFSSEQTGGHFQNWSFIQDNRGVMYVGNGYGILEFDGAAWRLIAIPNGSFGFTFDKDSAGRIYVGSAAELGYLAPDSTGRMQYVSLLAELPESDRSFSYVWGTYVTPGGIIFQTSERLFRFKPVKKADGKPDGWEVKTWRAGTLEQQIRYGEYIDGTFYCSRRSDGVFALRNDSLVEIPGSSTLQPGILRYIRHFPGSPGRYLVSTRNEALWTFDGNTFRRFKTEVDDNLRETIGDVLFLEDGLLAVGSLANGLYLIDSLGKVRMHLTTDNGLKSNVIRKLYQDRQGNIWMAMDDYVGILEYRSNLTLFPLSGSGVTDIVRHRGILYASTGTGIYYLDPGDSRLKPVPGTPKTLFNTFSKWGDKLYNPTVQGIYEISLTGVKNCLSTENISMSPTAICKVEDDSTLLLVGKMNGLGLARRNGANGLFTWVRSFPDINEYINMIRPAGEHTYWLGTYDAGTIRLRFDPAHPDAATVDKFGTDQGLPPGTVTVSKVPKGFIYSTLRGFYRYDEQRNHFEPDSLFRDLNLGTNPSEYPVSADEAGNIWTFSGKELALYRKLPDGHYRKQQGAYSRLAGQTINLIYAEAGGTTWFGMSGSIVAHRAGTGNLNYSAWSAFIRSVSEPDGTPILKGGDAGGQSGINPVAIPFKKNDLSFGYSGLSYIRPETNEFSIKLDGYDKAWSPWSPDNKRNYTNLSPGSYTFRVKSRSIIGQESDEAAWSFTILTPWYRTPWAITAYGLLLVLAVYGIIHLRTRQLRERSLALQRIVDERTAEIQEQKDNVEKLSRIGKDITASLSIENIIQTVYENVNKLMDASVFAIGLHKQEDCTLEFPAAIEKGELLPPFILPLSDENRLATWCFLRQQEVVVNDYARDFGRYISQRQAPVAGQSTESVIYLPLWGKEKVIGVITAQSFRKEAYGDYQLNMLRNLATYCAIALENADAYRRLARLLDELKNAQDTLVTQSKLAALGALTAGIAHEIKNPLNFVNNFSTLNIEMVEELRNELDKVKEDRQAIDFNLLDEILNTLKDNAVKIREHGGRADSIVRSMLQHSRGGAGDKQPTDLNATVEEAVNLTYHGMRAQDNTFNVKIVTDLDPSVGKVGIIPQDMSRVFLNIIGNACYEVHRRKQQEDGSFSPVLTVSTHRMPKQVQVTIRDNGGGIPPEVMEKLFTPFFTTKPAGQGTGLGLSISWDIVVHKHGGQIQVETEEGVGTEFRILLPA